MHTHLNDHAPPGTRRNKIASAAEAVRLIHDGDTIATGGFVGIVIAQVERVAERGTLQPRQVKVPGVLVDAVVVATDPAHHMQTFSEQYNPAYSGEIRLPLDQLPPMPMSERKIIARRHFEGLHIATDTGIAEIEQAVSDLLAPVVTSAAERVAVVVNYDNFSILPSLLDAYSAMVTRLTDRFYSRVTRYGTGGFLKARLEGRPAG